MRSGWTLLFAALAIAYPLAVYFGLQYMEPRAIGLLLAAMLSVRLWASRHHFRGKLDTMMPALLLSLICAVGAIALNSHASLRLTPAFINFTSMMVFALTLWHGPPMIERFARLLEPDLDAAGVRYTRRVTQAWCVFFFANGSIALYTALFTSLEIWTLYNGLIAYVLMGSFFALEWLIRRHVRGAKR